MGHIEKGAGRISLNTHVLGASEAGEGDESARLGNHGLVLIYDLGLDRSIGAE